jgi:flagellar hook-length control protein FliK
VKATVTVTNDQVVVQLSASDSEARQVLNQALPELRQLMSQGALPVTVTLSDGSQSGYDSFQQGQSSGGGGGNQSGTAADDDIAPSAVPGASSDQLVDIRI